VPITARPSSHTRLAHSTYTSVSFTHAHVGGAIYPRLYHRFYASYSLATLFHSSNFQLSSGLAQLTHTRSARTTHLAHPTHIHQLRKHTRARIASNSPQLSSFIHTILRPRQLGKSNRRAAAAGQAIARKGHNTSPFRPNFRTSHRGDVGRRRSRQLDASFYVRYSHAHTQ